MEKQICRKCGGSIGAAARPDYTSMTVDQLDNLSDEETARAMLAESALALKQSCKQQFPSDPEKEAACERDVDAHMPVQTTTTHFSPWPLTILGIGVGSYFAWKKWGKKL